MPKPTPKASAAPKATVPPVAPPTPKPTNGNAPKKAKTFQQILAERKVVHPDFTCAIHVSPDPITVERAKEILGWETESDAPNVPRFSPPDAYHIEDRHGRKVRFHNNLTNRPIYMANVEKLIQEILNRRWQFNGEPIIIGRTGLVLNGQHSLIAVVLAEQDRTGKAKERWAEKWDGPCFIEKAIMYGIEETDSVVNTMDTCKPRSLSDVLFRSDLFLHLPKKDRAVASKMLENAVRLLWERTGVKTNPQAWTPYLSQSEALDFISRHERLLRCVKHIMTENKVVARPKDSPDAPDPKGPISRYIPPGRAAGLCYLMAATNTDCDHYRCVGDGSSELPSEKRIDWECWDKAMEFWMLLGNRKSLAFEPLRLALASHADHSVETRTAILIRAWLKFAVDEWHTVTAEKLVADLFKVPESGTEGWARQELKDPPTCQGIDLGKEKPHARAPKPPEPELTEEQKAVIEQAKRVAQQEKEAKKAAAQKEKLAKQEAKREATAAKLKAAREAKMAKDVQAQQTAKAAADTHLDVPRIDQPGAPVAHDYFTEATEPQPGEPEPDEGSDEAE